MEADCRLCGLTLCSQLASDLIPNLTPELIVHSVLHEKVQSHLTPLGIKGPKCLLVAGG